MTYTSHRFSKKTKKGENNMLTQKKELSQEQIADAEKLCQFRQNIQTAEWPFLRTIFMAYMDGVGMGLQISGQKEGTGAV